MAGDGEEVVVVTGASGCLGFQTVRLLVSHDEKVREIRCLDLVSPLDQMLTILEEEKVRSKRSISIKWIQGDTRDINTVELVLNGADCVIHCASKVDIWTDRDEQDESELQTINVEGTENLLKASIRLGVHKFIHVSSFEVYMNLGTIYYATETTLPEINWFLFGASASTKKEAENKVRQYSNNKLQRELRESKDFLSAIIVRFPTIYGEFDNHYVSKILELTKFFGGKLQRVDNVWICQQPIYVGNAAWSLIKAKQRMDLDKSISGEDFHVTDETTIGDPFDFVQPYLECRGMHVTKSSFSFIPLWLLVFLFFTLRRLFIRLDFLGLFTNKKDRLQEAIERDEMSRHQPQDTLVKPLVTESSKKRWYHYVMPQTLAYMCNTSFLNRTKANLRLGYEPIFDEKMSKELSLKWYKNHLKL